MIPKANGKRRRLGIPTARDRVVQAALKLVLEPIFEADFQPCSYGFRPKRRAQDAIAEIHFLATRSYEWVLEGDIKACFDEIAHPALMDRVRDRIGDKRVLGLVKAFLQSRRPRRGRRRPGHDHRHPPRRHPLARCSPTSPCRSSTSTSPRPGRRWATPTRGAYRRRKGLATYRLVRYADDFVVVGGRHPSRRRGPARRGGSGARSDGLAPVGGEDEDCPHRRGLRLPRLPHPAAAEARRERSATSTPTRRRRRCLADQGQGADADRRGRST